MTDGVSARLTSKNKFALNRRKSAENAAKILGFSWEAIHNFKDNPNGQPPSIGSYSVY